MPGPAPDPVYEIQALPFDDVVVSGGRCPRTGDAAQFEGVAPVVRILGDTVQVSNIKRAIYSGYKAAMLL